MTTFESSYHLLCMCLSLDVAILGQPTNFSVFEYKNEFSRRSALKPGFSLAFVL